MTSWSLPQKSISHAAVAMSSGGKCIVMDGGLSGVVTWGLEVALVQPCNSRSEGPLMVMV